MSDETKLNELIEKLAKLECEKVEYELSKSRSFLKMIPKGDEPKEKVLVPFRKAASGVGNE